MGDNGNGAGRLFLAIGVTGALTVAVILTYLLTEWFTQ